MKIATLSPLEQKIYYSVREAKDNITHLEIIKSWRLTDEATLRLVLHNMKKKGWLIRLKRGVYLISDPNSQAIQDPFIISTYIFNGYNGFSSAIYIHKLTDTVPFNIYVATVKERGKKIIGQYSFEAVPIGKRAFGTERFNNYIVSTVPKTIYDSLHRPLLSGGLPAVLKALYEAKMNEDQWKEFLYYVKKFEKNAFYQRLGYLLSILPRKTSQIKWIINLCKKHVGSKTYLFGRKTGKFIKEWNVIDNISREKLLAWWYYG